jgi:hypothetical protein
MSDETEPMTCHPADKGSPVDEPASARDQPQPASETADLEAEKPSGPGVDQDASSGSGDQAPTWSRTHVYIPGKGVRFKPNHGGFKRQGLSRRAQAKLRYEALQKMTHDMAAAIRRGEKISSTEFTRNLHLLMIMEREIL